MREAIKAHAQLEASSDPINVAKLAREFDVDYTSLWRHVRPKGQASRTESLGKRQKLSPEKEKQLLELVLEFSSRGLPMTREDIRQYATHMANSRKQGPRVTLGKNWVGNFIDRHHRELTTHWSHPLDSQRTLGTDSTSGREALPVCQGDGGEVSDYTRKRLWDG